MNKIPIEKNIIYEKYKAGWSINEIKNYYKIPLLSVRNILQESDDCEVIAKFKKTVSYKKIINKYVDTNINIDDLSKEYNLSENIIYEKIIESKNIDAITKFYKTEKIHKFLIFSDEKDWTVDMRQFYIDSCLYSISGKYMDLPELFKKHMFKN
jgi:Mor family transcriptional regulator